MNIRLSRALHREQDETGDSFELRDVILADELISGFGLDYDSLGNLQSVTAKVGGTLHCVGRDARVLEALHDNYERHGQATPPRRRTRPANRDEQAAKLLRRLIQVLRELRELGLGPGEALAAAQAPPVPAPEGALERRVT